MAQEITEEMRVLITAEVENAVRNMKTVDAQTNQTMQLFKKLGSAIGISFTAKAIVDFSKASIKAYEEQKSTLKVLESTIQATGAAAWTSSYELAKMAQEFQNTTNYSASSIESMQSVLLGFKNITGETFKSATQSILDMATVMNMDLKSAAQSIGKALDDPINGMDSLKKQGFNFTKAQKQVMQSLIDTGKTAEAQKIILDELATTFGGAAEASVTSSAKLKNSFDDLKAGIGEFFTDILNMLPITGKIAEGIEFLAEAFRDFDENLAKVSGGEKYQKWLDSQSLEKQLDEATQQIKNWQKAFQEAKTTKEIDDAIVNLDAWRQKAALIAETLKAQQAAAQAEQEQKKALSEIDELMYSITTNYEKMSKTDPVIQLKKYNEELNKISKNKEKVLNSELIGIDKEEINKSVKELDYLEKEIKKKILGITINGKKTWQNWLSEIFKQDLGSFETGKEAADKFINGLEAELKGQKIAAETLGAAFDFTAAIDEQRGKVRDALAEMLSIDPSKIDEVFETGDASVDKLLNWYHDAGKRASESFYEGLDSNIETSALLEKAMGKAVSETDKLIQKQEVVKQRITEIASTMNETSLKDALTDQNSELSKMIELYKEIHSNAKVTFKDLGKSLEDLTFNSALDGMKSLGEALGEGKNAEDAWRQGLTDMSLAILDALPNLFLRAGLQLIGDGMWPIGLGLIAASGVSAIVAGNVQGRINAGEETEANALGGVYGASDYAAFAKGGMFTNQIVQSPTYFRFANGSRFGTGLMGEAGPEAIMPLKRGSDGSLGVSLFGNSEGASGAECLLTINVYSNEKQEIQQSSDGNGNITVDIVSSAVGKAVSMGKLDKTFKSRYGLKVQGV